MLNEGELIGDAIEELDMHGQTVEVILKGLCCADFILQELGMKELIKGVWEWKLCRNLRLSRRNISAEKKKSHMETEGTLTF